MEITPTVLAPSSKVSITISIHLEDRNVFARFDEISYITQDIKETVYKKAIKNYKGK